MIAKRVQIASHSSTLCEDNNIDFPDLRTFESILHRFCLAFGPNPVLGSSLINYKNTKWNLKFYNTIQTIEIIPKKITTGFPIKAIAIPSFFRFSSESFETG